MTPTQRVHHTTYHNRSMGHQESTTTAVLQEATLWKILLIVALTYGIWTDKVSIVFGSLESQEEPAGQAVKASLFDFSVEHPKKEKKEPEVSVRLPKGALNNVTFAIDPDYADRYEVDPETVAGRQEACRQYVKKYGSVAVAEMHRTGIPASITLAQGLLESNAGASTLARSTNNHFGMKCFSRKCKKGHCMNFSDDTHKDFFIKYGNVAGSYKAHSHFLENTPRYSGLFRLGSGDYRGWARGLSKAGYATDKKYGDKLIAIIQSMDLDRYDRM